MSRDKKLRVLGLPGWRTSARILEQQLALCGWTKTLGHLVQIDVVDPTFQSEDEPPDEIKKLDPVGPYYQWWFMDSNSQYRGIEQTIDRVADLLRLSGPYDGLLGFSQGSAVVNTLAALQANADHRFVGMFRFVVLVAGVVPKDATLKNLYSQVIPIGLPSLHIFGSPP
eukprot:GHVS01038865.1.p1 GENE.GHVS01038865.1~~GHVS01038865.1.p1  ORF type:complete len:169 (+),score=17.11 GHVS01038865.1:138-644(+)